MQWDMWLLASFKKYPHTRIHVAMSHFAKKMNITYEDVEKLLRTPKPESTANYCNVSRFICGYIPNGGDIVFNDTLNLIQKATLLSQHDSVHKAVDEHKCKNETADKQKTRARFINGNTEAAFGAKARELQARRAWSVCK